MSERSRRLIEWMLVLGVMAGGTAIRWSRLDASAFWVDEAESSINALTILEAGYPGDQYLGIPIYENMLVKPWPGNAEYEFRDLSYSDNGYAIYHGWLPLYAMATSFRLHGISPDEDVKGVFHARPLEELKRRTRAARLPSLGFAALYMIVCYLAGRAMYGRDAGAAALLGSAFLSADIDLSTQARYYSAQVALGAATIYTIWRVWRRGTWLDYGWMMLAFVALFFTHLTTFATAVLVVAMPLLLLLRSRRQHWPRVGAFAAAVGVVAGAWLSATGFISQMGVIPPARDYLLLPADLAIYPIARPINIALFVLFAAGIAAGVAERRRLPRRIFEPLRSAAPAVLLLSAWILTAYTLFLSTIPAASLYPARLRYCYRGASVLLAAIFVAALARMIWPRRPLMVTPLLAAGCALAIGVSIGGSARQGVQWAGVTVFLDYFDGFERRVNQKLYAIPNTHLILTFYSGLPWQSITPIRRSFLDSYPGEILFVDWEDLAIMAEKLSPAELRSFASAGRQPLDHESAARLSKELLIDVYLDPASRRVLDDRGSRLELPSYAARPLHRAREVRLDSVKDATAGPIFRGYGVRSWWEWVEVCHYRFSNVENRRGESANFASRLKGVPADLLPEGGWVIYGRRQDGVPQYRVVGK